MTKSPEETKEPAPKALVDDLGSDRRDNIYCDTCFASRDQVVEIIESIRSLKN